MPRAELVVDIVLATYNGGAFVAQLLSSISRQTYRNWRLVIRDDGSRDGTIEILRAFRDDHPERTVLLEDGLGNLGVRHNFALLARMTESNYVMFADQDDIWLPDKIEASLATMRAIDADGQTPVLVHSDLRVVDADGRLIAPSFWKYRALDPFGGSVFRRLLVQNTVTGCATMVNRALLDKSLPIPRAAIMHDWWMGLTAAAFGRIHPIACQTVLYRQHGGNSIGAQQWVARLLKEASRGVGHLREQIVRTQVQAQAFVEAHGSALPVEVSEQARQYALLGTLDPLRRRVRALRKRYAYSDAIRTLGFYLLM
ncbi:MAG: glycosyltransferase family 2 protein [Betaproteobacteria bacterium]|nr:glycosyltransferase family 2 protein [Betaproteobacteria bacterium]